MPDDAALIARARLRDLPEDPADGLDCGAEAAARFKALVGSVHGLRGRPGALDGGFDPR